MNITDRSVAGIKNYKIVKSNKLINSKHTLSPLQWRLILLTAAQIKKDDTEFNECVIGLRELFDLKRGDKISDKYNAAKTKFSNESRYSFSIRWRRYGT